MSDIRINTTSEWYWQRDTRVARTIRKHDYPVGNDVTVVEYRSYQVYDKTGLIAQQPQSLGQKIDKLA